MKTFESYIDFYNFLKDNEVHGKNTAFLPFINSCKKINKGCSCSKQRRIDHAITQYISLPQVMTAEFSDPIKLYFEVQTIEFKHNGGLFFSI